MLTGTALIIGKIALVIVVCGLTIWAIEKFTK